MLKKLSVIAAITLVFMACEFKEPVLPTWELIAKVPFQADDLIIGERLAADPLSDTSATSPFRFDNDMLFISLDDSLQLQEISRDALSITPGSISESVELDTLELNALAAIESPLIPLAAVIPELTQFVGAAVTIPDTTLNPPDFVLPASDFRSLNVIGGSMVLTLSNTLPFTIGPNNSSPNGMTIRVIGDSTGQEYAVFNFPDDIGNGNSAQSTADIGGQEIIAPLRFVYEVPVKGGETFTVTNELLTDNGIEISLELQDIRADRVVAKLEAQDYQDVLKVGYRDQTRVRSAEIASGSFTLNFVNHIPLASTVNVIIPAVIRQDGSPFQATLNLPASGELEFPVVFNNDQIQNPDLPGELIDSLDVIIDAQTVESNEFVDITADDSVSIDVNAATLYFRDFNGFLAGETLSIAPVFEDDLIDYEGFGGGVEFQQALLELSFTSGISIEDLRADIRVTAYHQENGALTDSAELILNDVQFEQGTPNNLLIDDQRIVDILNILPTAISFSGEVRASGDAQVARGDNIQMRYRLETPFTARLDGVTPLEGDTAVFTVNEEFRDASDDDALISATLNLNFANHTPIGGEIKVILSNDLTDGNLYDVDPQPPVGLVKVVSIEAAPVSATTGLVTSEVTSTLSIDLTEQELSIFRTNQMQIGFLLSLDNTGQFVTMRYSDYVRMLGSAEIIYQANKDE